MIKNFVIGCFLTVLAFSSFSHELTPTYPELKPTFVDGVESSRLILFNKREDVEYFEIEVFDEKWNPINFASVSKIIQVNYQSRKSFEVYIKKSRRIKHYYICTTSKLVKENKTSTVIVSKVCAKTK